MTRRLRLLSYCRYSSSVLMSLKVTDVLQALADEYERDGFVVDDNIVVYESSDEGGPSNMFSPGIFLRFTREYFT